MTVQAGAEANDGRVPIVYTIRGCDACVRLLKKLDSDGIVYDETAESAKRDSRAVILRASEGWARIEGIQSHSAQRQSLDVHRCHHLCKQSFSHPRKGTRSSLLRPTSRAVRSVPGTSRVRVGLGAPHDRMPLSSSADRFTAEKSLRNCAEI